MSTRTPSAPYGSASPAPSTAFSPNARTCEEPDYNTVLSRYNEFEFCSLHQPMVVPRMRGKVL